MVDRTGRSVVATFIAAATAVLALGAWAAMYPGRCDPKNMRYVLWKSGLVSTDLDDATCALTEDWSGKSRLILGKSEEDIRSRFGYLLTPKQAGPLLEQCVRGSWAEGKHPMFVRSSNLVVAFNRGTAIGVGILKPC